MRAFLEKIEKEWLDDFVYISRYPLLNMGANVIAIDGNKIEEFKQNSFNIRTDIAIGSVQFCEAFFESCGIETPKYLGYPDELKSFLHRNINVMKVSELNLPYPYFVKPKDGVKLFTGTTVEDDGQLDHLKRFYPITPDTELYVSEPVDFISEYRCFVHKGHLKGIQWYRGDFTRFPDVNKIQEMICSYKSSPVSYTLDVGIVLSTNKTILVEVNDMWAIGSYGFNADDYVRLVIDRFQEIAKTAKTL